MTPETLDDLQMEFYARYLQPFYSEDAYLDLSHSPAEHCGFEKDAAFFKDNPARKLVLRVAYPNEFSPDWYELHMGAFGDGSLGLEDSFLELIDREPKRIVLVERASEARHHRRVVWLGPATVFSMSDEWLLKHHVSAKTDVDVDAVLALFKQQDWEASKTYCIAWLAEFNAALQASPIWKARQRFLNHDTNAKAN